MAFTPTPATPAYATHGVGGAHCDEPTTFVFADPARRDFLGWVKGHWADGAVWDGLVLNVAEAG